VNVGCQLTFVVVMFPRAVSAPELDSVDEASPDAGRPQPSNTTNAPNMKSDADTPTLG
jgi:hypothetical protein